MLWVDILGEWVATIIPHDGGYAMNPHNEPRRFLKVKEDNYSTPTYTILSLTFET